MKIIVIPQRGGTPRSFHFAASFKWLLVVSIALILPIFFAGLGYTIGKQRYPELPVESHSPSPSYAQASDAEKYSAMIAELARMQSRMIALETLGARLAQLAGLSDSEFSFRLQREVLPRIQNHQGSGGASEHLNMMAHEVATLDKQLQLLSTLWLEKVWQGDRTLSGWPIKKGWISSHYGYRQDPFHGRREFHKGMDFAGKAESPVQAVAGGIVSWSGERYAYGNLVEINHGNGFVTRYGHNQTLLVALGDLVEKGQIIAKMGSSGRSTGPHVHFEVYEKGQHINPLRYVRRR